MTYSDFDLVANPSGYGYIQDGSIERYYEEALTNLIPTGVIIPTNCAYTASGRILADFVGSLKADVKLVDGVVDKFSTQYPSIFLDIFILSLPLFYCCIGYSPISAV